MESRLDLTFRNNENPRNIDRLLNDQLDRLFHDGRDIGFGDHTLELQLRGSQSGVDFSGDDRLDLGMTQVTRSGNPLGLALRPVNGSRRLRRGRLRLSLLSPRVRTRGISLVEQCLRSAQQPRIELRFS